MPLIINTNVTSLNAQRHLGANTSMLARSMERLSSGFRINRASDDAAGLQISESLRAQIRGSQKALDNTQDGLNLLNILDGTLSVITESIQRMRELTVQAANDTLGTTQRQAIDDEMDQLVADISRMSDATQFNGVNLLDGSMANFYLQVGPNSNANNDVIDLANAGSSNPFGDIDATALAINNLDVSDNANSLTSLTSLDTALDTVNTRRATLGALMNRLESTATNLSNSIENLSSSESRIRNLDVAQESATMTKYQILQQASATVLAQANQSPSLALKLLGG